MCVRVIARGRENGEGGFQGGREREGVEERRGEEGRGGKGRGGKKCGLVHDKY